MIQTTVTAHGIMKIGQHWNANTMKGERKDIRYGEEQELWRMAYVR